MDPDVALARCRELVAEEEDSALADAFRGLDEWLTRGGFPPAAWRRLPPEPAPVGDSWHIGGRG